MSSSTTVASSIDRSERIFHLLIVIGAARRTAKREMRLWVWNRTKLLRIVLVLVLVCLTLRFCYEWNLHHFYDVQTFSSSQPFWKDNRTYQTGRPIPQVVRTIDQVDLKIWTLAISACCRNLQKNLIGFEKNIRTIGKRFRSYRLFLLESDSTDGTLEFLQQWEKNDSDHVVVHSEGNQRHRLFFSE